MDREIDEKQLNQTRRRNWLRIAVILALLVLGFWAFRSWLSPSAKARDFRMATIERGALESTIAATGTVTPSFEQQLNAPIATQVKTVHLRSGTEVEPGDLILELDKSFLLLDVAARRGQLDLRKNSIDLLQLELDRDLKELEYDDEIKGLQVAAAEAALTDAQRLEKIGGATAEEVEQAETRLQILQLEKAKLENELNYRRNSLAGRKREVVLEANIQEQELQELENKLDLTEVRAPGPGVITWVNENIGEQVPEGNPLVRIADLRSFQIEASCSDRYADRVTVGQAVNVRLNDETLLGQITNILPAVANNTVEFLVALQKPDHPQLRPNMRLEVFIVTDRKADVLKVKQGPVFKGGLRQKLFAVRGSEAELLEVRTGISNGDYIELLTNELSVGDKIIISDTRDYEHTNRLKLN
ncbi:MAG: HlyD family efflux transporter periplasmic adaptor subunit [Bacteroidota bacterium]